MSQAIPLHNVPLWRPNTLPPKPSRIIVISEQEDLLAISSVFYGYHVDMILLVDGMGGCANILRLDREGGGHYNARVTGDINELINISHGYIVRFATKYNHGRLCWPIIHLAMTGMKHVYVYMPIPYNAGITTTHRPLFYKSNKERLEEVYALLEDDASRSIFASRVRALTSGNIGYMEMSPYMEYYHPAACPKEGDIILDGGVSAVVNVELGMSRVVGSAGHVWSFEPDPMGFVKAYDQLKDVDNVTLLPYGMWNECCEVKFTSAGVGSHVGQDGDDDFNVVTCNMMNIDKMVEQYGVRKVDLIKLDVEGAEKEALLGGIKTIVRHRPTLHISLYHKMEDLFELPLLVKQLDLDYSFYMGHHQPVLHETILYAVPK